MPAHRWIQDFELDARDARRVDIVELEPLFKEAFLATWRGEVENDGFNRLLLCAGLSAREIVVLRAYCRYLLQTGIPFSQAYMERVLVAQAPITRQTGAAVRNPVRAERAKRGSAPPNASAPGIVRALEKVQSLDEDRILRAYLTVMRATLRTNYFQNGADANGVPKSWVSFKLDPHAIPDLPLPRPQVRDLRLQPACRRRAPAHGLRGARRHCAGRTGARTSAPKSWAS